MPAEKKSDRQQDPNYVSESAQSRSRAPEWIVFALYLVLVTVGAVHHEVWRDEVRAYSIAVGGPLSELMTRLKNEGHPILWYLVLWFADRIFNGPIVLKIASLVVAAAGCFVFLFRAPFPRLIRLLWPLGFLPLYEYSVMCRNYGITLLLLFSYCSIYPLRRSRPIVSGGVLALLALSSAYGLIFSLAFGIAAIFEAMLLKAPAVKARPVKEGQRAAAAAGAILSCAGAIWAVLLMLPDRTTQVTSVLDLTPARFWSEFFSALGSHGSVFHNGFYFPWPIGVPAVILGVYLLCQRKPQISVFLFSFVIGAELLHRLVYSSGALRHQGMMFLAVVAALWLEQVEPAAIGNQFYEIPAKLKSVLVNSVLFGLVILQIYQGQYYYRRDITGTLSSAPKLARLISSKDEFADAVITGEPDFVLESIPYYLDNRTYLPRERRFGRVVSFTKPSRSTIDLNLLLDEAASIRSREGGATKDEVIVLLPPDLDPEGGVLDLMYGRSLHYSGAELERLAVETEKLAVFNDSLSNENFAVYRLR